MKRTIVFFAFILLACLVAAYFWRSPPTPLLDFPDAQPGETLAVWMVPAGDFTSWERLVAAAKMLEKMSHAWEEGVLLETGPLTFPAQSATNPSFSLKQKNGPKRLTIYWVKISSEAGYADCIRSLLRKKQPPVAFLGGSNSDDARDLALALSAETKGLPLPQKPLLLISTATALKVPLPSQSGQGIQEFSSLLDLYPEKTFRFGFDNQCMGQAMINFVWSHPDLSSGLDSVHFALWDDNSYARDFVDSFWNEMRRPIAKEAASEWAWVTSSSFNGFSPFVNGILPVVRMGPLAPSFRMTNTPVPQVIDSSVGVPYSPNRFEKDALRYLLQDLDRKQDQRNGLLVMGGSLVPARRFIRELAQSNRELPGRLAIIAGDAISFDSVYRDREVSWPIPEIPFPLVFFAHANPVSSEAGFFPLGPELSEESRATATDELILSAQILEGVVRAALSAPGSLDPNTLKASLKTLRWDGRKISTQEGKRLFDMTGSRSYGTGEFIGLVKLLPRKEGSLVESLIEIWSLKESGSAEMIPEKIRELKVGHRGNE